MRIIVALLLVLLAYSPAFGDPTFDAANSAFCGNCTSVTVDSHVIGSGCLNPILVANTAWDTMGATVSLTSVVATGGTLTPRGFGLDGSSVHGLALASLPGLTGSQSVTATVSGTSYGVTLTVRSYCGVSQTAPHGTLATANGSTSPITVNVSSATGELVADSIYSYTPVTVGSAQNQRVNFFDFYSYAYASSDKAGAATTPMSWTQSEDGFWASIGIALKPAPTTGGIRRRVIVVQ